MNYYTMLVEYYSNDKKKYTIIYHKQLTNKVFNVFSSFDKNEAWAEYYTLDKTREGEDYNYI